MAEVGEIVGGYKLRSLLQTSHLTQVFEAVEPLSGRHFAMKILLPEVSSEKEHRKTLFHEADIGIKLRHENVINIIKVNQSESTPHFIMEFFPSGSIRTRLMSKDPREKEFIKINAKKIFKQVATGLAYMNASKVVHCDIKADNILVNALGQTKIIDFAIAKRMKTSFFDKLFHREKRPQGTPSFMSPEQIQMLPLDGRSDVYSFGATLYELCVGRPPFRGSSISELLKKHLVEKPSSLTSYNPDVTDEFSALVVKCLAKKKEDRYAGFHEVLMELKKIRIFKSITERDDDEQL
ncbi:serine/threonine protein kinase [Fimbriiglobus ruber]|uniref:mitogen-activated protein kinase kinase n=1 Tax=Fimbriiglobus ruber TaxID=1908690 RepID=A0A225E660_9BACT|nr:serine/threonine-protein kinase [Fimbriiglobus ruber]OWK47254.1 serine/threonine protein kinase [Fimbriiglobus ruber]